MSCIEWSPLEPSTSCLEAMVRDGADQALAAQMDEALVKLRWEARASWRWSQTQLETAWHNQHEQLWLTVAHCGHRHALQPCYLWRIYRLSTGKGLMQQVFCTMVQETALQALELEAQRLGLGLTTRFEEVA